MKSRQQNISAEWAFTSSKTGADPFTMNDRERFLACMAYQPVDHVPFWI